MGNRYIVTSAGPIDRHQPGADVTGLYTPEKRDRLIKEGFIAEEQETSHSPATPATEPAIDDPGDIDGNLSDWEVDDGEEGE